MLFRSYYAFRIHFVSTKADEGGVKGMQPLEGYFQLLKSRKVDNVCGTIVVHEDSPGIEPFYHKHNDQGIVMRLLHSSSTFLLE